MVSVIIPTNGKRPEFIGEAIQSVEKQSYTNWELIIEESDNGVSHNLNKGIAKAKGKYICYLSDDDKLTPHSLKYRVNAMERHGYDFLHARAYYLFSGGLTKPYKLTNPEVNFYSCLENNGIHGGTLMYKTSLLKDNLFNEDLWTAEEWELNLRLLHQGCELGFLNRVVYLYRRHQGQKSIGNLSNEYQAKRQKVKDEIRLQYRLNG